MIFVFLLLIIFFGFDTFTLLPWYHVKGVFRVSDLGLVIIFSLVVWLFIKSKNRHIIFNGIGFVVLLYLFMTLIQVVVATVNYNQPILSGLIQSRHQFYYLSYFVFLLALSEPGKAEKFLKYCSILAGAIVILSIVNYIGPTVFHHRWGEGQGERSGIVRAFVPGLNLIAMMFIYYVVRYAISGTPLNRYGLSALFFFFALLFRQTRGRIIAAVLATGWIMYREKQFKSLAIATIALVLVGLVLSLVFRDNLLFSSFQTAYTDVSEEEGTWRGRKVTMQHAWETFLEHPVIGSGARFIRQSGGTHISEDILRDAYQGDLGYAHWLKNFGLAGVIWMILLAYHVWKRANYNRKSHPNDAVTRLGEYQVIHVAISFLTINYLVMPDGIIVVCLALALLHCAPVSFQSASTATVSDIAMTKPKRILRMKVSDNAYEDCVPNNKADIR